VYLEHITKDSKVQQFKLTNESFFQSISIPVITI